MSAVRPVRQAGRPGVPPPHGGSRGLGQASLESSPRTYLSRPPGAAGRAPESLAAQVSRRGRGPGGE